MNYKHHKKCYYLFGLEQKKVTYFYKDTIVYAFVEVEEVKKGCRIMNDHYSNIMLLKLVMLNLQKLIGLGVSLVRGLSGR